MNTVAQRAAGKNTPARQWTQEEVDLIRRRYQHTKSSLLELTQALDATEGQVTYQLNKMGMRKPTNRRAWTDAEDEVLRSLITKKTVSRIAKTMNRSMNSVALRAGRLGINRGDRDGWYTLNETCEILGKDAAWIIKRIENGALKATRRNLNPRTGHWHIERKDLRDFIRKYPEDLTGRNVDLVQIVEILTGIVSPEVR